MSTLDLWAVSDEMRIVDRKVLRCLQEFYAKLQHNNQRFNASWHEHNGLRLSMSHAF